MKLIPDVWRRRRWRRDRTAIDRLGQTRPATLITGGSEGIGLALAEAFTRQRTHVVIVARDPERLQRACQQLPATDCRVIALPIDVTEPDAAITIKRTLSDQGLHVEELINNAGIGSSGHYAKTPADEIDRLVDLNISALNRLTRTFLPEMIIRGRGGIINVASLGGLTPGPYQAAYYASKAYVISLTRALAHENRGMGLSITCIAPGPVETAFHARMNAEQAFYRRFLPALTPAAVARSTIFWYGTGRKVVVPGMLNSILALALGVLPGALTIPVVAFLLNPGEHKRDV